MSCTSFLNPLSALPTPSPICGSLPAPKMMSTMARIMMSSDMPIVPNMVWFLCDKWLNAGPTRGQESLYRPVHSTVKEWPAGLEQG